jgi:hypothetical protein
MRRGEAGAGAVPDFGLHDRKEAKLAASPRCALAGCYLVCRSGMSLRIGESNLVFWC